MTESARRDRVLTHEALSSLALLPTSNSIGRKRPLHEDEAGFHATHRAHTRHTGKKAMVGSMRLFVYRQLVSISHPDKREVARTLGT